MLKKIRDKMILIFGKNVRVSFSLLLVAFISFIGSIVTNGVLGKISLVLSISSLLIIIVSLIQLYRTTKTNNPKI